MMIYHYTTIETLALIVKNKTLRFNKLTHVDDQDEGETADYGNLGDYAFVSCWTNKATENVVLWNMYAKEMTGVRIGINAENIPFELYPQDPQGNKIKNIKKFSEKDCVFLLKNSDSQCKYIPVEYTKTELPNLINRNEKGYPIIYLKNIAALKSEEWQCQQEIRFVLFGATTENNSSIEVFETLVSRNQNPPISSTYVDLQLNEKTFSNMEITLSPKSSEAQKIICDALLTAYLPPDIRSTIQIKKVNSR